MTAPASTASGISPVSALDASAIERSNPAMRWKRLIVRRMNAGRSQNVNVLNTRPCSPQRLGGDSGSRSRVSISAVPPRERGACSAAAPLGVLHRGLGLLERALHARLGGVQPALDAVERRLGVGDGLLGVGLGLVGVGLRVA